MATQACTIPALVLVLVTSCYRLRNFAEIGGGPYPVPHLAVICCPLNGSPSPLPPLFLSIVASGAGSLALLCRCSCRSQQFPAFSFGIVISLLAWLLLSAVWSSLVVVSQLVVVGVGAVTVISVECVVGAVLW